MAADATVRAAGYNPRRTLPFTVEFVRQLRRRRTMIAFGLLLLLPWILVGAFEVSGSSSGNGTPGLVAVATQGGLNFAAFSVFVSTGFLFVVAVALFCGDTVAIVVLPAMALVAGTVAFGWHPLRLPATGVTLPTAAALGRLAVVVGYVLITELVVAGLAFLLSVSTDSPLGAVGGAVGLVIISNILDDVTALGSWRELLPTHWQFAWLDAMQAQISWTGMIEGTSVSVSYAVILAALAFRHFRAKDIVS
jgi:ABC-2 type transport system permease protein